MNDTELIDFLSGAGKDASGRSFDTYINHSDQWWERCHDHIQWAFPLPMPSIAQPQSPVASLDFYDTVRKSEDAVLRWNMAVMAGRFMNFLQATMEHNTWMRELDHNHLRISRAIRCLRLCGLEDVAQVLYDFCVFWGDGVVAKGALTHWKMAVEATLPEDA